MLSRHTLLGAPVVRFLLLISVVVSIVGSGVGVVPSTTCSAQGTCPQPAAYGRQPYVAELASVFDHAGTNQLGQNGPRLLQVWSGYPPSQLKLIGPYIPCILLKAIGYTETTGWKQFNADYGQWGFTRISADCGYGIMQVTSGMDGTGSFEPYRVTAEPAYNIGAGANLLIGKWNVLKYFVGANDPHTVEDWYFAVWAYNGWGWYNNPNNTEKFAETRDVWKCGTNPHQERRKWPYQELIWGCAANPPRSDSWTPVNLTLPPRWQITNPPPAHIDTPQPSHGSCSVIHLPLMLNNRCSNLIVNSDFEHALNSWNVSGRPHITSTLSFSGRYSVLLGSRLNADDVLYQDVSIPTTGPTGASIISAHLSYAWYITTEEHTHDPYDFFYAKLKHPYYGSDLKVLQILTDNSPANQWYQSSFDVQDYVGQSVQVFFRATSDSSYHTNFFLDNVVLNICEG